MNNHRWAGATIKKRETRLCAQYAILIKPIQNPINLTIYWFEKDLRRDIDNVAFGVKFILDGLRESNRIPNDTRRWVKSINHFFPAPDKKNPRVEVVIEEEINEQGGTAA